MTGGATVWRDLLETEGSTLVLPWIGGRSLHHLARAWHIDGVLPREHSWVKFELRGRKARVLEVCYPEPDNLSHMVAGYLVGDRLIRDGVRVAPDPRCIVARSERVHLIEPGLDRFTRISAGRASEEGPLIFVRQEMPLGPEFDVQAAYLDELDTVDGVPGVTPALDAAFRIARWQRLEARRRRSELEAQRQREAEARQREERRRELLAGLGDGMVRREMALVDFEAAARAALAVGGVTYLEHRRSSHPEEMVVRFRMDGRRYECTCDRHTLRILDAGICLTSDGNGDFEYGVKGDTFFTLESLPGVIRQADREGKLVVFRHVD